jgi:hypothetical protein
MRRAVAVSCIAFAIAFSFVVLLPAGALASAWACQAESASGAATGVGSSRKEAEDRALGNCAANSARFAICRIVICRHGRESL